MIYTKEKFKELWESNSQGGGITCDDCADCAEAWGIIDKPRCHTINEVIDAVCKAANCEP